MMHVTKILTAAVLLRSSAWALSPSAATRRSFLRTVPFLSAPFVATSQPHSAAAAADRKPEGFVGVYSDPNHPGGKRDVRLLGEGIGDYRLAEVLGGGGIGEPKEYRLPAVVVGDKMIIIDFGPKGGPRDFAGGLEKDGGIRFFKDGNKWPRIG
mmetsp:Transcript_5100/g.10758  ORF Transcript_5100/g.10758 Transcript_5100/m.10758 type:complete len:154 (+) Transcript_5100:81-542(+)|eukprot:CAMPEP_0194324062 /NCGR_PEP_ID=MMETSP0171-20130528/26262_1 /TAXON_ID=218684 /ORGANISM="Corethron pennatum, Strain L29A3" /LENGTH=153 /DNA_ID=CAMNT_0039082855 /DNA_START=25 /DNA_END=486 /DNA_ORIENTATION=+